MRKHIARFSMPLAFLVGCSGCSSADRFYDQFWIAAGHPSPKHSPCAFADDAEIQFLFLVPHLHTAQHFPEQTNQVIVRYGYAGRLLGGNERGIDAAGHEVANDRYPFFQTVRTFTSEFLVTYPNKAEFYE